MGRVIIVGDVHGCIEEFRSLVQLVSYNPSEDRLILCGDLMDRGPDPAACVKYARELGCEMAKGNHEDKHVRWRNHEKTRGMKKNPVISINELRASQNLQLSDEDVQWMQDLPLMVRVSPTFVVVHAGLEPAFSLSAQSNAVMRIRYINAEGEMVSYKDGVLEQPPETHYWATRWAGPESVAYGHAVHSLESPRLDSFPGGACYGLDTGCVFGGRLTAMVMADGQEPEFAQVQAREVYYSNFHPTTV